MNWPRCISSLRLSSPSKVSSAALSVALLALAGCGTGSLPLTSTSVASTAHGAHLSGNVIGGNQPISGATVQLYAVSSAGDAAPASPLLTTTVTTAANGTFNITGDYPCTIPSTPVYLTATGGNPGLTGTVNNTAIALMAFLGPCGNLSSSTFINVNEVTTVGSLAAIFPFASGYAAIGSQSSDATLMASAAANVPSYINFATGTAPGPSLGTGLYASSQELYGLANVIASCINSTGGVALDGSPCGSLFALATPVNGVAPTDTISAILDILKCPTQNVGALFSLAPPSPPFEPAVSSAPAAWVLPITSTANPNITLAVSGASTVNVGTPAQYSATVTGTSNATVLWQVNGVTGGNSLYGTISPGGVYTPPAAVPTANALTITALSGASTTAAGTASVSLLNPVPLITTATGSTTTYGQTFLVDVQGAGFVNGATLTINGSPVSTTAVSTTDLQTTVTNTTNASIQIAVAVANPSPGATQSTSSNVNLTLPGASATAAARFLDQTSFGPTAASISHVQSIGLLAALQEQFNQPTSLFTAPPITSECVLGSTWRCTQSDWIKTVVTGSDQLRQRISLILNEIWVAPEQADDALPYALNTQANDAFTNYRTIMQDLTLSPQMGAYLNMVNSGVAPTGQIPNENFGRENMQLFTLGVNLLNQDGTPQLDSNNNTIQPYTEAQVQAFAKAYTGWTYANTDCSTPAAFNYTANWNCPMVAVESKHDKTAKTLLNGTTLAANQTAEVDLKQALDNIFAHTNVGPFICTQLIQHLVEGNPSPAYVSRVSAVFANNGSNVRGDMKAVLTAILLDPEARAADTQTGDQLEASPINPTGGHLREPMLFVPNVLRGLGATQTTPTDVYPFISLADGGLASLGEQPFAQASVFNFYPPSYVIPNTSITSPEFDLENTGSVIPRLSLANSLIHSSSSYGFTVNLGTTGSLGSLAATPSTLVDYLGMIFMHSQMPTDMRTDIINEVTSIPSSNPTERAAVAAYLVLTSSQYKVLN